LANFVGFLRRLSRDTIWAIFESRPTWPFCGFGPFNSGARNPKKQFFTTAIYGRGGVTYFLPLTADFAFSTPSLTCSALCLASLFCALAIRGNFIRFFLIIVMARVKSTARYVGSAAAGGSGSEGRESGGL
jgi:hypothetical protein